ncbi:MAG TPA: uroporphyrinogen-III C-methyltransferase [Agriterribacter sp.]|nr:uroporphyrinogen-III C-methyltransferase [Agriterribacter sp.]
MIPAAIIKPGKVILAAAGPGDPELITVKAMRYLQQADVVLTDRLVSNDILKQYVNPSAKVIYVGKQCRRGTSTPQQTINQLLIDHASEGKLVVRLKGGDVSVFSNILDELQVLVQHHIAYEIIPGVTAALGAAAYTGIPLTARGHSTAVRLLTYYTSDVVPDQYWQEIAGTSDTLVFYMSAETVEGIVSKLIRYGVGRDKHIAVIEQATTPLQQVYTANIYDYLQQFRDISFISPSLVIIGKVVALHEQFGWFTGAPGRAHYFKSIASLQNNTHNQQAHVSRA